MSFIKNCTGGYYNHDALEKAFEYCLSKSEWWNGNGIRTDYIEGAIFDMRQVKILAEKEDGKQLYHVVVSIWRQSVNNRKAVENKGSFEDACCYLIGNELSTIIFNNGFQNAYFKHIDGNNVHLHFIINSVNFYTGKKLSGIRGYIKQMTDYLKKTYPFLSWEGPYFV